MTINALFRSSLAVTALFATLTLTAAPIPAENRVGGFAIGCQAYSFNRFTLFEAIEKTEQTGSKVIEFFPGQALSPDQRTVKWDHNCSDEVIAQVKEKLAKHGIRGVNYGVVGIPSDEAGARKIFDFAKKLGLYGITTESTESIEIIDKLVKEYDIRVGYHNHPRQANNPNYKVWDPNYILALVKDRDARVGSCADIGHWQTSGLKPVDCLKILEGHVISMHGKERPALGPGQHDVPFGSGGTDMAGVLAELKRQHFVGNISVEYEYNWDNSVPEIAQCIGFVRGWAAGNMK
jgi:sugar phosphate isomerase/epimerase